MKKFCTTSEVAIFAHTSRRMMIKKSPSCIRTFPSLIFIENHHSRNSNSRNYSSSPQLHEQVNYSKPSTSKPSNFATTTTTNNTFNSSNNSSNNNTLSNTTEKKGDLIFDFLLPSSSSSNTTEKSRGIKSADDYLKVCMQSIVSKQDKSVTEENFDVKDKLAISASLSFKIKNKKYRVRWWLSMLTSYGENGLREEMEILADLLLNRLFVFPEKRDEVLMKYYGTTMAQVQSGSISGKSSPNDIISLGDLVSFYKSFSGYELAAETESSFLRRIRMISKSQLISNYCLLKDLDKAREVFYSVMKEEGSPSQHLYNQMMSSIANLSSNTSEDSKGIISEIEQLFSEIESPSTQCIHTMLHAYAKFGRYTEMEDLTRQLEDKNPYTYSILLYGYTVAKRFSKALEVYSTIADPKPEHIRLVVSLLLQVGLDIQGERLIQSLPDSFHKVRLTNELMDLYTKTGDFNSVVRLFESLENPDCYSLGIAMNAYVKQKQVSQSLKLFSNYCEPGIIPPNSIIYNLLLHGISMEGDYEKLDRFFNEIPPTMIDQKTLVTMISAYLKNNNLKKAEFIYKSNHALLKDSLYATTSMIRCYASSGKIHRAEELYLTIKKPDLVLCNIMLDGYAKSGDMQQAYNLFTSMYKRDLVSYNTMLKGYANNGMLHNAEIIFNRIDEPDSQSFLTMLNAYFEHGEPDSVEKFYKSIPKRFKSPFIYTCMMKFYSKLNKVEKVKYFYGLVGANNFHADHLMLNTYLKNEDYSSMREMQPKVIEKYFKKGDAQSRAIYELLKKIPSFKNH